MSTKGRRKCCHCGIWFRPGPRNPSRQWFCPAAVCRVASKRASQRKWTQKNQLYFRGEKEVKRVQAWRQEHPGYWRKHAKKTKPEAVDALQDLISMQPIEGEAFKVLRNRMEKEISRPLQDIVLAQQHALVGLTSMITGDALQEDIAQVLTSCYERGQRIGGMVPWMNKQEVSDEGTRTGIAETAVTHSTTVQLGRSPPDS